VKAPKVYVRDSGILHSLLGIQDLEALYGHPELGASFEGFAIEQILALLPPAIDASFYRTHTGDELDLVLSVSPKERWAVEIKFSSAPALSDGMVRAMKDVKATCGYVVMAGGGLQRGVVLGESNARGEIPKERPIRHQDVLATMYHQLGIDYRKSYLNEANRPVAILNSGEPIQEIL